MSRLVGNACVLFDKIVWQGVIKMHMAICLLSLKTCDEFIQ